MPWLPPLTATTPASRSSLAQGEELVRLRRAARRTPTAGAARASASSGRRATPSSRRWPPWASARRDPLIARAAARHLLDRHQVGHGPHATRAPWRPVSGVRRSGCAAAARRGRPARHESVSRHEEMPTRTGRDPGEPAITGGLPPAALLLSPAPSGDPRMRRRRCPVVPQDKHRLASRPHFPGLCRGAAPYRQARPTRVVPRSSTTSSRALSHSPGRHSAWPVRSATCRVSSKALSD